MSDDLQLSKKLAALSQDSQFEDGAMRLGPAGGRDALGLILEAIDNTVLPRKLTFAVGDASVTLAVGGRRLSSVVAVNGPLSGGDDLVGQLLANSDAEKISELGQLLSGLVKKRGTVMLTRQDAEGRGGQSDTGVAVTTLADSWGVDPFAPALPRAEQVLRSLEGVLLAHSRVEDGQLADPQGEAKAIDALGRAFAETARAKVDAFDALDQASASERCITLDGILPDGALLSLLNVDNDFIILATVADTWSNISLAWSEG